MKYLELLEALKDCACPTCNGTGKLSDVEPGDICFNCATCGGDGFRKSKLKNNKHA